MQLTITLRRPPPALYCLPVSDFILKILSALSVSDFVTQRCCQMVSRKRHYFGLELLCGCRGREPSLLSIDNKIFMISPHGLSFGYPWKQACFTFSLTAFPSREHTLILASFRLVPCPVILPILYTTMDYYLL